MFDWDDLRHFTALADEGSLSAAARRLQVEHATVARRIAALEVSVGAKLVDRRAGRYVLTPDGERVVEHARRMEAEAFSIERVIRAGQEDLSAEVSVSVPPLIATLLIAPKLPELKAAYPRLRLRLQADTRTVSLPRREADLAVRLSRPNDASLVARKIGTVEYRLFAAADYLDGRSADNFEFIAFDESLDGMPQQAWLREIAGPRPILLRSNDLATQCAAATAGIGIAALPDFAGKNAGLRAVDERSFSRDVWLAYHGDMRGHSAVSAVAAFLVGCIAEKRVQKGRDA